MPRFKSGDLALALPAPGAEHLTGYVRLEEPTVIDTVGFFHVTDLFNSSHAVVSESALVPLSPVHEHQLKMLKEAFAKEHERVKELVRKAISSTLDNACWRDIQVDLARAVGISDAEIGYPHPAPVFLNNCIRFEKSQREGSPYIASACPKNDEKCPGMFIFDTKKMDEVLDQKLAEAVASLQQSGHLPKDSPDDSA